MTDTPKKRAFIARRFTDRGTGASFEAGATPLLDAGTFANYEAAGLLGTPPASAPKESTPTAPKPKTPKKAKTTSKPKAKPSAQNSASAARSSAVSARTHSGEAATGAVATRAEQPAADT